MAGLKARDTLDTVSVMLVKAKGQTLKTVIMRLETGYAMETVIMRVKTGHTRETVI